MQISDNARGVLYMNVSMAAFTLNDACMKAATNVLPLFQAITLRGALAVIGLLVLGVVMGGLRLPRGASDRVVIAVRTVAEVGGTVLFLTALLHMPLANLSAILQFLPLAVTLGAALVLRERVGWRRMLAIVVGFIGVLIIIRPGTEGFDEWSVMGLGAVACVAVRDLVTRRLSREVPSATVAVITGVAVTTMGLLGSAFEGWAPLGMHEALLILGASSALIVGYMYSVMVMRVGDIGLSAPFRYMALLWAIVLGWIGFGTLPDQWTLIGGGLVVATGIFTLLRERRLARAAQH